MKSFNELELLYLRRCIILRLEYLGRSLEKNRRYFRNTDDDVLYQRKIGSLESEEVCLKYAVERINIQIGKLEFKRKD